MNRGQVFESRKNFVECFGELMEAKKDFLDIQYARASTTGREYVRVRDIFGKAAVFEITKNDLDTVLADMCRLALMGEENVSAPRGYIDDLDTLRKIAPLFM